jgi:hypothetical protein
MTDITDELKAWVMRNIASAPGPTGSNAKTDASSGNALNGKGGGRARGGEQRARATAQQGEEACEPMGKGKKAGANPRQLEGQEGRPSVVREATTTSKGTRYRIYRVVPLLAVVVSE